MAAGELGQADSLARLARYAARYSPFYREKLAQGELPLTRLEELAEAKQKKGDPYSGRLSRRRPWVSFQLEGDPTLYLALDGQDLAAYAQALSHLWSLLGLKAGDRVAVFDFGTSPVAYLASTLYVPGLTRGAADALGCVCICNDGLPELSGRAAEIIRFARPRALFLRLDCVHPFGEEAKRLGLRDHLGFVVVATNEGALDEGTRTALEAQWGVPIWRLLRADAALFLAGECPACRRLHAPQDLYHLEVVAEADGRRLPPGQEGLLVVTSLFARTCPALRYLTQVRAALEAAPCPQAPDDWRFRLC